MSTSDFLYPFIEGDETDVGALLVALEASAHAKAATSFALRRGTIAALADATERTAEAMERRFRAGGKMFVFGNGGSSTDAAGAVALFAHPPYGVPCAARSLVADHAVLTALANDVGYELVFSRQLISMAGPNDIALGLSTSGGSANLLRAFVEAHRIGMLTVGLAGYDGGAMAAAGTVDNCLVVGSDSVHRIQEVQSAILFDLWQRVQRRLDAADAS